MFADKIKYIKISLVAILAFIIGISIFFIKMNALKSASIDIMVAPLSAEIYLNGTKYNNAETHKVMPGDYQILIKKDGYFEPYSESFTIGSGETKSFYLQLIPLEGTDWYENHPEDTLPTDAVVDKSLLDESAYIRNTFPLFDELPYTVEYYKNGGEYVYYVISYDLSESSEPSVIIRDYSGNSYEEALQRIRNMGYNPDDYIIVYQDNTYELKPSVVPNN